MFFKVNHAAKFKHDIILYIDQLSYLPIFCRLGIEKVYVRYCEMLLALRGVGGAGLFTRYIA